MNTKAGYKKFVEYMEAQGRSPRTIGTYEQRLNRFLNRFGDKPLKQITPEMIDQFIAAIRRTPGRYADHSRRRPLAGALSPHTINGIVRDVKRFLTFCEERGYIKKSPAGHLQQVRRVARKNKAINRNDLLAILELAKGEPRDYALIRFLVDTGARGGEVLSVTRPGLNLEERTAVVFGKTGQRVVDFTAETAGLLRSYLATHEGEYLFVSLKNDQIKMTHGAVWLRLKKYAAAAGITGRYGAHAIRHLVGYTWAKQHDLERTRQKLGHSDIKTTMMYANVDREELKRLTDSTEII
jgi:integrase/recombinase XerD